MMYLVTVKKDVRKEDSGVEVAALCWTNPEAHKAKKMVEDKLAENNTGYENCEVSIVGIESGVVKWNDLWEVIPKD